MNHVQKKQNDSRYIAVDRRIRAAFYDLLLEKGFRQISIKMIVDRAAINRSTFYLHYSDKYDLLREIEEELAGGLLELAQKQHFRGVYDADLLSFWRAAAQYIWDHKDWYTVLNHPNGDPGFLTGQAEAMRRLLYGDRVLSA